jgi:hypothetical protein
VIDNLLRYPVQAGNGGFEAVNVRMTTETLSALRRLASQARRPSRPTQTIRRLVELWLKAKRK